MLGLRFEPGVIYADDSGWLRVKTRGPVITRGVDQPTIRLTAVDEGGRACRARVYARRDYRTATAFPSGLGVPHLPEHVRRERAPREQAPRERAPREQPKPRTRAVAMRAVPARPRKQRSRSPQLKVAPRQESFLAEACYWLPLDMGDLRPAQHAIAEELSVLPWAHASAVRWSSDGILVEHDIPAGLDAAALATRLHHTQQPSLRQVEGVRNALEPLLDRGLVELSPADRRLYRLRGWQCLHTRRRTTRRAIEHGGGRAVFATVRFSA